MLDPASLVGLLLLYRLARKKYANLSGIGAAAAPGRWNRFDQEAIYTSTEIAVPVLEKLVHTPKELIPTNLASMTIEVRGDWKIYKDFLVDKNTGSVLVFYRTLAEARQEFDRGQSLFERGVNAFAVAVPSVIVPVWNVVLYPQGDGFWKQVRLANVEPFTFDPRLFPKGVPTEP